MAIVLEQNSVKHLSEFRPLRCDTHFIHYIKQAELFFARKDIEWVELGSVLDEVKNGLNVATDFYSMEPTSINYISVSQVKEYGLVTKNQNHLTEEIKLQKNFWELQPDTVIITRSGTIGVALSTNHPTFDFSQENYVASGFLITAKVKPGVSADVIASYINLNDVQQYLTAMAAGACQKNISQPTVNHLPIPACLISDAGNIKHHFDQYQKDSLAILRKINDLENEMDQLKLKSSEVVKKEITKYYNGT